VQNHIQRIVGGSRGAKRGGRHATSLTPAPNIKLPRRE
jgi:hypothetical protein